MGKHRIKYSTGSFVGSAGIVQDFSHGHVPKKENIISVDVHNAGSYQNQELPLPRDMFEYFRHLRSGYKGIDWSRMSKKKKILFGAGVAAAAIGVVGMAAEYGLYKGEHVKYAKEKIFSQSKNKAVGAAPIVIPAVNVSVKETVKPTATVTPYSYDARAGSPDPSIKFIDGFDKEESEALSWNMEQFNKSSPYDVDEFQKYLVFRLGKNPTAGVMQFTKDKREIIYLDDAYMKSFAEESKKDIVNWNFYRLAAHEVGHKKFNKKDDGCNDSKCIEMPALTYDTDAMIRAGQISPEKRDGEIKREWDLWKQQHGYVEK